MSKKSNRFKDFMEGIRKNKNIILGVLSFILVMDFIAIVTGKMGVVGHFFALKTTQLLGIGAYYLLPIMATHLVLHIVGLSQRVRRLIIFLAYLTLLIPMIIVDINLNTASNFSNRIYNSLLLAELTTGGGLIGGSLGYLLQTYIGKLGTYILSALILLATILSFLGLSFGDFIKEIFYFIYQIILKLKKQFISGKEKKTLKHKAKKEEAVEKEVFSGFVVQDPVKKSEEKLESSSRFKVSNYADEQAEEKQLSVEDFNMEIKTGDSYKYPPISLLKDSAPSNHKDYQEEIERNVEIIESTLDSFNITAKVLQVNRGPSVTSYELQPGKGVKVSSIVSLADNLALSLASSGIRIEAPIPGKSVVGIEVPNEEMEVVAVKDILVSKEYSKIESKMPLALGKDVYGKPVVSEMDKMPHLLIAGATGSGKSVCINTIITSILYKSSPEDVKFILIDPKKVELNEYNGIPHLILPVVTDPKKASAALSWVVSEMDRRYELFARKKVRDIGSYKKNITGEGEENLPYILVIIDELSDLMMVAPGEVEDHICRIAQMARACGIHLIVATQRPTVDVITGTIKANIPSRIAFAVSSQVDSRTILDSAGAENLLGRGDMLFAPSSSRTPERIQGAFISESEVHQMVSYIKENQKAQYNEEIIEEIETQVTNISGLEDEDEYLSEAIDMVIDEGQASISMLQRRLRIGHARAGRIVDQMEALGVVGPSEGSKPRRVLVSKNLLGDD